MALRWIVGRASSSLPCALNFQTRRLCCDSEPIEIARHIYYADPSDAKISKSDGSVLAKYVPPGLPFWVRDFGTGDGLFLERRYGNELFFGQVNHMIGQYFLMEFTVIKPHLLLVFETTVMRQSFLIDMLVMRSPMCGGENPSPNQCRKDYLEGFDNFLETKGINSSTLKFLFDRFETGMRPLGRAPTQNVGEDVS